ncbi:hypothetical protein [Xanthomonas translucens]|uniref:hypothetical protein n=1 Tax=Xanthomonas campestris pv. translucens TaxID=343 RepID=UPI0013048645|nr:hypothetical protein [Xanthomonas translucens]
MPMLAMRIAKAYRFAARAPRVHRACVTLRIRTRVCAGGLASCRCSSFASAMLAP